MSNTTSTEPPVDEGRRRLEQIVGALVSTETMPDLAEDPVTYACLITIQPLAGMCIASAQDPTGVPVDSHLASLVTLLGLAVETEPNQEIAWLLTKALERCKEAYKMKSAELQMRIVH